MTTIMFAQQLVDAINSYYEKETVYLCKKDFGKCYTKEDKHEVVNWGLKEWVVRISRGEEIGDINEFYRTDT
ncbi:hypothetical protein [Psychrobacillus phage Perkons]|nr:hypothetical protein [Psychrobacillus phage Perkons]